jgi:biotin operon repressor
MMTHKEQILDSLLDGPASTHELSMRLDTPEASIRRNIQELRAEGHYIEYVQGLATLVAGAVGADGVAGGARGYRH